MLWKPPVPPEKQARSAVTHGYLKSESGHEALCGITQGHDKAFCTLPELTRCGCVTMVRKPRRQA